MVRSHLIIFLATFLFSPSAGAQQICPPQNYDDQTPPNFECPGPEESVMVPDLNPPPSVPVHQGESVRTAWDGALVHRDRMIELGLKVQGIRRLRWADRLRIQAEYNVEREYAERMCTARVDLVSSERDSYRDRLTATEQRLTSERSWYRSWWFGLVVGVVGTGVVVVLTAYALHAVSNN